MEHTAKGGSFKIHSAVTVIRKHLCVFKAVFNLFEQSLLLFCESGSELCFKPHNGYKRSAFVCAVCYALRCFSKE